MQILERSQGCQVEDRAQVNVEPLGSLPGEYLDATGKTMNSLLRQILVVGCGAYTNVAGWRGQATPQDSRVAARINQGYRIELFPIPIRTTNRRDRAGVVEEGIGIADLCLEAELVRDIGKRIPIIVDFDLIQDIVAELKEVGATRWLLQRNIVADQGDCVRLVRANECVNISAIGHRVL